jgi:hypothetical protein
LPWLLLFLGAAAAQPEAGAQTMAALCRKDGQVRFFDGRSGKLLASESAGRAPVALAAVPELLRLYVAQAGTAAAQDGTAAEAAPVVHALGIVMGRFETLFPLPGCRNPAGLSAVAGRLYVACSGSADVLVLSADSGSVHARHRVGRGVGATAYHAETESLLAVDTLEGQLLVYDMNEREIRKKLRLSRGPAVLQISPAGAPVAVLSIETGTLWLYDPEAETLSRPIELGARARGMRFVAESSALLAACDGPEGLVQIDLEEGTVERRLDVGPAPGGIAVDAAGQYAWVSSEGSDAIARIDLERWVVEETIPMPGGPVELLLLRD